jgi:fructosamine-3-kinase
MTVKHQATYKISHTSCTLPTHVCLAAGFEDRHQLYQLYHYLNHTVLFGGGYAGTSQRIMESLLRKL